MSPRRVEAQAVHTEQGLVVQSRTGPVLLSPAARAVWEAADGARPLDALLDAARAAQPTLDRPTFFSVCDELSDAGLLSRAAPPTSLGRRHVLTGAVAASALLAVSGAARAEAPDDVAEPETDVDADAVADDLELSNLDTQEQLELLAMPEDEDELDELDEDALAEVTNLDPLPPLVALGWDEQAALGFELEMDQLVQLADGWANAPLDVVPPTDAQREQKRKLAEQRQRLRQQRALEATRKRQARRQLEMKVKQERRQSQARRQEQFAKLRERRAEEQNKLAAKQAEQRQKGQGTRQGAAEERVKLQRRAQEARAKYRESLQRQRLARLRAREQHAKLEAKQRDEQRQAAARRRERAAKAQAAEAQATAARRQELRLKAETRAAQEAARLARAQEQENKASARRSEEASKTT